MTRRTSIIVYTSLVIFFGFLIVVNLWLCSKSSTLILGLIGGALNGVSLYMNARRLREAFRENSSI